jgi:hypothetical protein
MLSEKPAKLVTYETHLRGFGMAEQAFAALHREESGGLFLNCVVLSRRGTPLEIARRPATGARHRGDELYLPNPPARVQVGFVNPPTRR